MAAPFQLSHPFDEGELDNVRLTRSPLVRVFIQARWQEVSQLKADFGTVADNLSRALSGDYPFRSDNKEINILVTPDGPQQQAGETVVQFRSATEEWRVYFTSTFLTLETTTYVDVDDAGERFGKLLDALHDLVAIPRISRLGFRYVNRIADPADVETLPTLVRDALNIRDLVPVSEPFALTHSITESLFRSSEASLMARWGYLPEGGTLDPSIEAVDTRSWVLDLDAFQDEPMPFERAEILKKLRALSQVSYRFFRWSMTDRFASRFGAAQ